MPGVPPANPSSHQIPPATKWLLAFQSCNAVNFTIALGAPVVLTARYLGATESAIGLITALSPLLAVLQIFTTNFVDRYGPRQMMLWGWGARSFALLVIVPLPLLVGHLSTDVLVALIIFSMLLYNLIRGFAAGAWFPWLNHLLPENIRGTFFGFEQRIVNLSTFVTLLFAGMILRSDPPAWAYSLLFLISVFIGWLSVRFLAKAPDDRQRHTGGPMFHGFGELWKRGRVMWQHPAFRRTTRYMAVYTFAITAVPGFLVLYVREELKLSEGLVLFLQSVSPIGVLLTSVTWGRLSDRVGSRPMLRLGVFGIIAWLIFWLLTSTGIIHPGLVALTISYLVWGVFTSMHGVAQSRVILGCCPPGQMTFGISFFQVIISLAAGSAPLIWGVLLEWIREPGHFGGPKSFGFTLLFLVTLLFCLISQLFMSRVPEAKFVPTHQFLMQTLYDWPMRVVSSVLVGGKKK